MTSEQDGHLPSSATDWLCTVLAVGGFFAYIMVIAFAPAVFSRPVSNEGLVSIGLASGILLTVFLVLLASIYTYIRNSRSRR